MSRAVAACAWHARDTQFDMMVHTVKEARAVAAREIDYARRYSLPPEFWVAMIVDSSAPCCSSAGLARSVMAAAWRELLTGESR